MKRFDYDTIDSTNEEAKRKIIAGESGDFLLVAKEQTKGKGRKGRGFYSPKDTGVYMSFVHVGNSCIEDNLKVTSAAAVIVRNAISDEFQIECDIKWVNDLYHKGMKVCGILCECLLPDDERKETGIIVGIGININTDIFPDDIANKAGSVLAKNTECNIQGLIVKISEILSEFFDDPYGYSFIEDYRKYSCCIGKRAVLSDGAGELCEGLVKGITDEGYLILEKDDKTTEVFSSCEISLLIEK